MAEIDCGWNVMAEWAGVMGMGPAVRVRTTDNAKLIYMTMDQIRAIVKIFKEHHVDVSCDNDKRKSGQTDNTGPTAAEVAKQGILGVSISGSFLAQSPDYASSRLGNQLQRKIPVDTERVPQEQPEDVPPRSSFEDHYPG